MAVNAIVKDGQLVESASQSSASASVKAPDGYDKDAFLQLLVAQMKYQDPMEPTSNTEYIAQYATFSQVEQLQNMSGAMNMSRASTMVGQTVQITTEDSKGEPEVVEGVVDYVKYENNKAFVSVGGELYSADSVSAVIDKTYNAAYTAADEIVAGINKLPLVGNLSLSDLPAVTSIIDKFNAMDAYQQSFLDSSYADLLKEYSDRMEQLVMEAEKAAEANAQENAENNAAAQDEAAAEASKENTSTLEDANQTVEAVEEA